MRRSPGRPDVSVVMPCLNEENSLAEAIRTAKEALATLERAGYDGEILIADNGSTDASRRIAAEAGCRVVDCAQKGYGSALLRGCDAARGRFIVMGDADASYDFREAVPMIHKLAEGYALCMGSRVRGRILPGAMPWKNRYLGNPVLTGILNLFFRSGLSDVHCGLRAFTKEAFSLMRLSSPGMEFASEMVVKATILGLKRTETPVTLHPDRRGRPPHLKPWRDGWRHLKFLLMYSPVWLYFVPAAIMMFFGGAIFALMLLTPSQEVFTFMGFWIGDHWLFPAAGVFLIGYQALLFGFICIAYHDQHQFLPVSRFLRRIHELMTVENAILVGTSQVFLGLAIIAYVFFQWKAAAFGPLAQTRSMVVATTLIVMGFQNSFACFLLSTLGGSSAKDQ